MCSRSSSFAESRSTSTAKRDHRRSRHGVTIPTVRRFAPLLGILIAASCSQPYSLVGTWDVGGAEVSWPGGTATITFSSEDGAGNGRVQAVYEGPQSVNGIDLVQSFRCEGTYSLQGNTLKWTYSDIQAGVTGLDAESEKRYLEAISEQKSEILASINSAASGEIKWKDRDTFEYRADGVATFRRQPTP